MKEKVGPIEVEYAASAAQKVIPAVIFEYVSEFLAGGSGGRVGVQRA